MPTKQAQQPRGVWPRAVRLAASTTRRPQGARAATPQTRASCAAGESGCVEKTLFATSGSRRRAHGVPAARARGGDVADENPDDEHQPKRG